MAKLKVLEVIRQGQIQHVFLYSSFFPPIKEIKSFIKKSEKVELLLLKEPEEGYYTFDESASPTFFAGQFGEVFKEMWTRFT